MPRKILVVQDDPDIAAYLVSLFRQQGFMAHAATDGPDAVDMAKSLAPDLVTIDMALPEKWGPRFYSTLKAMPTGEHTPVILVTDMAGLELMVPDAVGTVDKPFDPDRLLALIRKGLGEAAEPATDTTETHP